MDRAVCLAVLSSRAHIDIKFESGHMVTIPVAVTAQQRLFSLSNMDDDGLLIAHGAETYSPIRIDDIDKYDIGFYDRLGSPVSDEDISIYGNTCFVSKPYLSVIIMNKATLPSGRYKPEL